MKSVVSIVMPVRNVESTIVECIDSILAQTFAAWELIVVNDGSRDGTPEILDSYCAREDRITVLHLPPVGIVDAPMAGVQVAQGIYLCRMDGDDVAHRERIARQVAYLEANSHIALCGCGVSHIGLEAGEGRLRYLEWINAIRSPEEVTRNLFVECPIAHPASLMRRADFDRVGGYQDFGWAEDYDLIMRFAADGLEMANVEGVLLQWRHSEGRLSMNDSRYSLERFRELKRHYLRRMYLNDWPEFYQWGAGAVGKTWLREWGSHRPKAVVDIAPRKIGKRIHDTMVIEPDGLPGPGESFTVVAVGAPGARDEIREWFVSRGYQECRDFLFLA